MLRIRELEQVRISHIVMEFMSSSGRSHVVLLKAWKRNPDMADNYENLLEQLAFAVQNKYPSTVVDRILGRISVVRRTKEVEEFSRLRKKLEAPKPKNGKHEAQWAGVLM